MDDTDDFVTQQFDGPQMLLCKECKQIKPLADCVERVTMCKACYCKPRNPSEKTARELQYMVDQGKLHAATRDKLLATRKRNALAKQTEAQRKRWARERADQWDALIVRRNAERTKAKAAYDRVSSFKRGYCQYRAAFYAKYMEVLDRVGEELRRKKRNGDAVTVSTWEDLVTRADQSTLRELWAEIPEDMTKKGQAGRPFRTPVLLERSLSRSGEASLKDLGIEQSNTAANSATPSADDTVGTDPTDNTDWDAVMDE